MSPHPPPPTPRHHHHQSSTAITRSDDLGLPLRTHEHFLLDCGKTRQAAATLENKLILRAEDPFAASAWNQAVPLRLPRRTTTLPAVHRCFEKQSLMPVSAAFLFAWHERSGAFERLAPPWEQMRIIRKEGSIRDGDRLIFAVRKGPFWLPWEAAHKNYVPVLGPSDVGQFEDVQVRGPFAYWSHIHSCRPFPRPTGSGPGDQAPLGEPPQVKAAGPAPVDNNISGQSLLHDQVEYSLPLGLLGRAAGGAFVRKVIERMFTFRHERTLRDVRRHALAQTSLVMSGLPPLMRVGMSGSGGAIGSQLLHFLTTGGHRVDRLVRRKADATKGEIFWQPGAGSRGGQIDDAALEGCDAIIHLAGEGVASGRWTPAKMAAIRDSRVEGTKLIARAAASLRNRPRVLVVASGIHYYGDRGDQELTEEAGVGSGFLAEVSREWEAAVKPAEEAGIRVVILRIGLVLSPRGGLLARLLPFARAGLMPVLGSGTQWWSWIGQDDLMGVILHALSTESVRGPLNAVAPQPVTMREFADRLARTVKRPLGLRVPGWLLRAGAGEMADVALTSTRAVPDLLRRAGFKFMTPSLSAALSWEILGEVK